MTPPRILLIRNARSGSADHGVDLAAELREHGAHVDALDIADVDDHTPDAATDRVIVAGGDGSIAPAARIAADLDVPLGVVPAGTANDFARALQLPDTISDALALAADGTARRPIELGLLDGRPFVNVVALGVAPHAAAAAVSLKSR
ncbi:MAG: NAD(+)/NADH kinase, partial [Thermoleophilia bacterium]|nr:NAD(+)/NADH kinase [Thermoleophilia bacterium]